MPNALRDILDEAYLRGKYQYSTFRKRFAYALPTGGWGDGSMAAGVPLANYYLGNALEATLFTTWYSKGIFHGFNNTSDVKYMHRMAISNSGGGFASGLVQLCDFLLFYPMVDMDTLDDQYLDNTTASLSRYTDGVGVSMFLVATTPYLGGQYFQITYTNSDGVAGRKTELQVSNTSGIASTLVHSNIGANRYTAAAFIPLMPGDKGVRSVEVVQFFGNNGGLASLVLVKPIALIRLMDASTVTEVDLIRDRLSLVPIKSDACLNFLVQPSASISGFELIGDVTFIWR